jgi:hypothetical protein
MRHTVRALTGVLCSAVLASCGGSGGSGGGDEEEPFLFLADFQPAAFVIGQFGATGSLPDAGAMQPNATGLREPFGPVGGGLFVVDTANHRILGFDEVPTSSGEPADFVLGQSGFMSVGPGTTASKFRQPTEAIVAGGKLFVADFGNNRVLIWNSIPTDDTPADVVVGQPDLTTGTPGTAQDRLHGPAGIAVSDGRLFVAEQDNNRVLIWNTIPTSDGEPADSVLGQADFVSSSPGTTDVKFRTPTDVAVHGGRIFVADTANNRVLIWNRMPPVNGFLADLVLGQSDFVDNLPGGGPTGLFLPTGVAATASQFFVVDGSNSRVLVYDDQPTQVQEAPDHVLGQGDSTHVTGNDDDQDGTADSATARTVNLPSSVVVSGGRLFVTDSGNHRVLVFESL